MQVRTPLLIAAGVLCLASPRAQGQPVLEPGLSPAMIPEPSGPPPPPKPGAKGEPRPPPPPSSPIALNDAADDAAPVTFGDLEGPHPTHFDLSLLTVLQSDGNSFSPELTWTPRWRIGERVVLRLGIGATMLKGYRTNFFTTDYSGFVSWGPRSAQLDLGVGAQTWFGQGTSLLYTAQGNLPFARRFFGIFSRTFLAYAFYPVSKRPTHELRAGLGVDF